MILIVLICICIIDANMLLYLLFIKNYQEVLSRIKPAKLHCSLNVHVQNETDCFEEFKA